MLKRIDTILVRQITLASLVGVLCLTGDVARGQVREGACVDADTRFPDHNPGPGSLKQIPVLEPTNLSTYVRNRQVAIAMGKALFWDMQVGSDGIQACATCHFKAGADPRSINQLNTGGVNNPSTTISFGVNYQLKQSDFPFHKLSDPTNRKSTVLRDSDEVVSSAGVRLSRFVNAPRGATRDITYPVFDPTFNMLGLNTRRAEPRNTPTVINAAYNRRQFWDVRARNIFNGVNPFGQGDEGSTVLQASGLNTINKVKVRIDNAGLASQAVGPPLSDREMGSLGRTFQDVGKRLVSATPLKNQKVSRDDSVLGSYVDRDDNKGLDTTYEEMIKTAFQPQWWQSNQIVVLNSNGSISFAPKPNRDLRDNELTMAEYNFSLFFGLAVQLYEMTLISDDAPIDRYFEGNTSALNAQQIRGLKLFSSQVGDAACSACHSGAETTDNSTRILFGAVVNGVKQPSEVVERMYNGQCQVVAYDQGVYNLGVRPTAEDLGSGNTDPFGNPLSWIKIVTSPASVTPSAELRATPIPNIANPPLQIGERTVSQGTFKVPNLRNLALTAPYFHNGGQGSIRQVVEFYNRGGDFREQNVDNIDFEIGKLNLTSSEIDDLVAFLAEALLDDRVRQQKAPFDHPQLFVPNGHKTFFGLPVPTIDGVADELLEVPAVGRNGGNAPKGFLEP